MSETEKKLSVRNLERISEKKFRSYDEAAIQKAALLGGKPPPVKVKIFARYDGTYDVVGYKKIGEVLVGKKVEQVIVDEVQKVHGQKSKDRKKSPKKAR